MREKSAPARSCQHLNFFFLVNQNIATDWEPKNSSEKSVQLASSFSLFFSVSPQVFLDFSQQLLSSFKNRAKIQMFLTQMERVLIRWHVSLALCTLHVSLFFWKGIKECHLVLMSTRVLENVKTQEQMDKGYILLTRSYNQIWNYKSRLKFSQCLQVLFVQDL